MEECLYGRDNLKQIFTRHSHQNVHWKIDIMRHKRIFTRKHLYGVSLNKWCLRIFKDTWRYYSNTLSLKNIGRTICTEQITRNEFLPDQAVKMYIGKLILWKINKYSPENVFTGYLFRYISVHAFASQFFPGTY